LLIDAIRADAENSGGNDAARRLLLVPLAHVTHLGVDQGRVNAVHASVNGMQESLVLPANCKVIVALSAIESTRLALRSFPTGLMGRNLMVHTRSDFSVRIRRSVFGSLPIHLQTAALIARGATANGVFHLQMTAAANQQSSSDELLFRMIPDIDSLQDILANHNSDWVAITLRGIAEMKGDRNSAVPNAGSWINLSPYENDEFGIPRAWVQLSLKQPDLQLWQSMDQAALDLVQKIAGSASNIEYLYDNGWQSVPPPLNRPFPEWHRGLGTTYHECGTLWMGDDPATSVTDTTGRFHHISNAYVCDQSLFPTSGSANPVLTGLTLARRVAQAAGA
jgi:hypothetical protein